MRDLIYYYKVDENKTVYITTDKDFSSVFEIRRLMSILNSYDTVEDYIRDNYESNAKIIHWRF